LSDPTLRRFLVWEAPHDNGWTTVVLEQPDGTFIAWAGQGDAIGVDWPRTCSGSVPVCPQAENRPRRVFTPLFILGHADAHDEDCAAIVSRWCCCALIGAGLGPRMFTALSVSLATNEL
jgi:hypothetical protein